MRLHRLRSREEYESYITREREALEQHRQILLALVKSDEQEFEVKGFSYPAGCEVMFKVDFLWSSVKGQVNWRDRVSCPITGFTNRWRATIHLFDIELNAYPDSKIYITEQMTPLFTYFADRFNFVIGSEYLGENLAHGSVSASGVRNENLCDLSFPSASFDILLSFDVIEHVPDFGSVFRECYRVLRNGGRLHWTVPFSPHLETNVIRARIADGEVQHLLPPEYHGDPLCDKGVLCFTHFGWEMLEQVRETGFRDIYAVVFHSVEFGYLGEQFQFFAWK